MTNFKKTLSLNDFSYEFAPHLVAQTPLLDRDQSRLLVRSNNGDITHSKVDALADLLPSNTLLVVNDTKVFASRLFGKLKDGTSIEIFLLAKPDANSSRVQVPCFLRPAKKVEEGDTVALEENCFASVVKKPAKGDMSPFLIEFTGIDFSRWLGEHAYVPLPPYIKREAKIPWNKSDDAKRYQTVYANEEGSVAAPTAGLHFTNRLLEKLAQRGIRTCPVTLHVSAGTFLPVKTQTVSEHAMHTEQYSIPSASWLEIQKAKDAGQSVIAVGTTSFRSVESFIQRGKDSRDLDQWLETNLFVYPRTSDDRYSSEIFDGIISNFHQPCSTLFMLICALIGFEETQSMYKEAVREEYRLFSYGDTSLIWF